MMLALGSLLAHLLSKVVPWLAGLCVLNVVILVTHFIAIGFFHPETPRFLFAVKDRKADCAQPSSLLLLSLRCRTRGLFFLQAMDMQIEQVHCRGTSTSYCPAGGHPRVYSVVSLLA